MVIFGFAIWDGKRIPGESRRTRGWRAVLYSSFLPRRRRTITASRITASKAQAIRTMVEVSIFSPSKGSLQYFSAESTYDLSPGATLNGARQPDPGRLPALVRLLGPECLLRCKRVQATASSLRSYLAAVSGSGRRPAVGRWDARLLDWLRRFTAVQPEGTAQRSRMVSLPPWDQFLGRPLSRAPIRVEEKSLQSGRVCQLVYLGPCTSPELQSFPAPREIRVPQ